MNKVLVIHGPNLNLLGKREPNIYGKLSFEAINQKLIEAGHGLDLEVTVFQSNHEGELIDQLQAAESWAEGVVFNPGGYTHTSVALHDAIASIDIPVIEVHISNIFARENFRKESMTAPACAGTISGLGWQSYLLGIYAINEIIKSKYQD